MLLISISLCFMPLPTLADEVKIITPFRQDQTASLKMPPKDNWFASTFKSEQASNHVISHRGASGEKTEHTFEAYNKAISYGSKYIEQDLVNSKNNTLYISHDEDALRMTGVNKRYDTMSDNEINRLRTFDGHKILTLADVFKRYKRSTHYVIELKQNDSQIDNFINVVRKYNLEKYIIVQAGDLNTLHALDKVFPNMPKLLLVGTQLGLDEALTANYVDIIGANESLMTRKNIRNTHDANKIFNVWTLDQKEDIKRAIFLNVDSYFTNLTNRALTLEKEYR